ncbi:MAG TPA: tetratricopeptide repeat protein [Verrucomicrobiae bacterium]|nr:tetratricopeptide repeat protein [Verrucomicrobiae bacterium]
MPENAPERAIVPELDHANRLHLDEAEGWLGLGDWVEANIALDKITPELRAHPDVLRVRCMIYCDAAQWQSCAEVAGALLAMLPEDAMGWINRAYALRRAPGGSVQAAYDALLPAADRVHDREMVLFNLACYSCQLGRLKEAREWLTRCLAEASRHGMLKQRRLQAQEEPDLKALWQTSEPGALGEASAD